MKNSAGTRSRFQNSVSVTALAALMACSSPTSRQQDSDPLPTELPSDLKAKFEVHNGQTSGAPTPAPVTEAKSEKKGVKAKKVVAEKKPPKKAFVYPDRRTSFNPVGIGEKITMEITYIGMAAGDFTLETLPTKIINGRKVYHLRATAVSSKLFSLFYRVNDWLESYWDYEGLFSHRFHLVLDESKQTRDSIELNDSEKRETFYWSRRKHVTKGASEIKDYKPISAFPQDSFSSLFYLRTLPLEVGKVYSVPVVSEGKEWEAVITVVRKEKLQTPEGKLDTLVMKLDTKFQGVLKQAKGETHIWLTDDDRRFLVRLEASVKIGTVVAALKKLEKGEKPVAKEAVSAAQPSPSE